MGIRFITCVYINGKCKVAQYSNNSGFPADAGVKILNFLKASIEDGSIETCKENVLASRFLKNEEILDCVQKHCGGEIGDDFKLVDFYRQYPQFSIDTGTDILNMLVKGSLLLKNDISRANDGIFTEYGYVIDFDSKTFEVYKGFNKKKLGKSDRFYSKDQDTLFNEFGSYPITLLALFNFNSLPDEKTFLDTIDLQEDALSN